MRDKRNRGCFGQTLFGHGQSTYKRGYHPSLSPSRPDLRCSFSLCLSLSFSRARSPPLLSPLHHSQLSRALYAACTYTSPPIAFSLALCLMNAHSNILSQRAWKDAFTREKWPFAPTTRSPSFPNYSDIAFAPLVSRFSLFFLLSSCLCVLLVKRDNLFGRFERKGKDDD